MDHQKTGALIAQRRRRLNLTQKELADQLSISDRTVSKWERGMGFPDISLIEPLADTLGLTIVELLHGQEESPLPNEEQSARQTLQVLRPEVEGKLGRARRWNRLLAVLLIVAVVAAVVLALGMVRGEQLTATISATEATAICEHILITGQDYDLLDALWQDETVIASFASDNDLVTLDDTVIAPYRTLVDTQGLELRYFIVQVMGKNIHVEYGTELTRIGLERNVDGTTEKFVAQLAEPYPNLENGRPNPEAQMKEVYWVHNDDNTHFFTRYHETGLAALF